jgi:hypothetical protein
MADLGTFVHNWGPKRDWLECWSVRYCANFTPEGLPVVSFMQTTFRRLCITLEKNALGRAIVE